MTGSTLLSPATPQSPHCSPHTSWCLSQRTMSFPESAFTVSSAQEGFPSGIWILPSNSISLFLMSLVSRTPTTSQSQLTLPLSVLFLWMYTFFFSIYPYCKDTSKNSRKNVIKRYIYLNAKQFWNPCLVFHNMLFPWAFATPLLYGTWNTCTGCNTVCWFFSVYKNTAQFLVFILNPIILLSSLNSSLFSSISWRFFFK